MADREYKINLKIEADASGSAPVDSGLKRVAEGAKQAEESLKKVEEQSKRTEKAVQEVDSEGVDGGTRSRMPRPRGNRVRSWHTPEQAAEIEQLGPPMRNVASEARTMEGATRSAGVAVASLGTASIAAGAAVTAFLGLLAFSARKELEEFGSAALDGAGKLADGFGKVIGDFTGFPADIKFATSALKEWTGAAAEERGEEQKLMNAKLDAALARQKVRMAAEAERAAIDEVARAIGRETIEIDNRRRAIDRANAVQDEEAKTREAVTKARFAKERAELDNVTGISERERAERKVSIDQREFDELQNLATKRIKDQIDAETKKETAAYQSVQGARDEVEAIRGRFQGVDPDSAAYKNLEKQLEAAQKYADQLAKAAERQSEQSSERKIRLRGELGRIEEVGGYEREILNERSKGTLTRAAEKDNEEVSQAEEKRRMEALTMLREQVLGGMGGLRGRIESRPDVPGGEEAIKMITGVERAVQDLERGGATGREMEAFQQSMQRLAVVLQKLSPTLSAGMRTLRTEIDQRLLKIEEEIGALNAISTK